MFTKQKTEYFKCYFYYIVDFKVFEDIKEMNMSLVANKEIDMVKE